MVFQPDSHSRIEIRKKAEMHLRNKYQTGIYHSEKANEIIKHQFNFYNSYLLESLTQLDQPDFLFFFLYQYDLAAKINHDFKENKLNIIESEYWEKNGAKHRMAISYIIDQITQSKSFYKATNQNFRNTSKILDFVYICAEKSVEFSNISNEMCFLLTNSKLEVHPENSEYFISTEEDEKYQTEHLRYSRQAKLDINLREKYIVGKSIDSDWNLHSEILDPGFHKEFGYKYSELMYILTSIILNTNEIESLKDIPYIEKDFLLKQIELKPEAKLEGIENWLEGLILKKEDLDRNERRIWKYKQPYRINKRPLVQVIKGNTSYLTWSSEMLKERLSQLDRDLIFNNPPKEWDKKHVRQSLSELSNYTGDWFEKQVESIFRSFGVQGSKIKDRISHLSDSVNCKNVGGFDYLGYSRKSNHLILAECKFIDSGFEPRSYRDDLHRFTKGKKAFIGKLKKKTEWILENHERLIIDFSQRSKLKVPSDCNTLNVVFLTYVKTFASYFFDEYPCASFTEFFESYGEDNLWPYANGIFILK